MARLLVIMFGTLALGQSSFEVASVKAADPKERNVDFRIQPGGRLTVVKDTLQGMITMAFSVKRYQLKGGPGWLVTDRFNIEARADGNPDRAAMLILFRNLLRERFGLQVHREAREGTIYALTEAKSGHRFKSSRESESQLQLRRNTPRDPTGSELYNRGAEGFDGSFRGEFGGTTRLAGGESIRPARRIRL